MNDRDQGIYSDIAGSFIIHYYHHILLGKDRRSEAQSWIIRIYLLRLVNELKES